MRYLLATAQDIARDINAPFQNTNREKCLITMCSGVFGTFREVLSAKKRQIPKHWSSVAFEQNTEPVVNMEFKRIGPQLKIPAPANCAEKALHVHETTALSKW